MCESISSDHGIIKLGGQKAMIDRPIFQWATFQISRIINQVGFDEFICSREI